MYRMDIEVVSNIQSGCSVNKDEFVQKQWLKFAYSGKMDPDMGLCSSLYRMTLYSQDMYLQEKKIAPAIIPYLNEYELDTIAQNFLCQYAPDMLKYAMPLPVSEVFQRMGLNAGVADLPKNTLGQLCFAPRTVGIYSIEA